MTADVASRGLIIFVLLAGTEAYHRPICLYNLNNFCFPHKKRVKEDGKRVHSDFHHSLLIKVIKTRCENSCCCAKFVLLDLDNVFYLATERLEVKLKVLMDEERCFITILVIIKFYLFCLKPGTVRKLSINIKLFVASEIFFCAKMSKAAQAGLVFLFFFCENAKKPRNVCNKCVLAF